MENRNKLLDINVHKSDCEKKHQLTSILDGSSPAVSLCISKAGYQYGITEYLNKNCTGTKFSPFIGVLPKPNVFIFYHGCSISV